MRAIAMAMGMLVAVGFFSPTTATAQITRPTTPRGGNNVASLQDVLTNNLRATTPEQQSFLNQIVVHTNEHRLDQSLVLAIMRYAQRKNSRYPFPYFERGIRIEAAKRKVSLPEIALVVSTKSPRNR